MGKNKEHKVGDIINVTLEIKEQENINEGCKGCFFDYFGLKCCKPLHYEPCVSRERSDGKYITGTKKGTEAMARIMWAVGVNSWEDLKSKYCRVKFDEETGRLTSVGHIVKDKWFNLVEYMKRKD